MSPARSRPVFLVAALVVGLVAAWPFAAQGQPRFPDVVLRVAVFGGAHHRNMHAQVGPLFEKTGARVEYTFGNPRDHLAKLVAARGKDVPFDVVILDEATQSEAIRLGLLDPLSADDVPAMRDIHPRAIPHKGYGPAKNTVSTGIAYNTRKFQELGLPRPTKWDDLFQAKLAGHVAVPDLTTVQGAFSLVGLARLDGGSEKNIAPGFQRLSRLKVLYYYRSSSDLETKFISGDVWAAAWVNGRTWTLAKAGQPLEFVDPRMGDQVGMVAFNTADLVKGGRAKEAGKYYIDLLLQPDVQVAFARTMFYGPTNRKAAEQVAKDPGLVGKFPYRPEDFDRMVVLDWSIVNPSFPRWIEEWNRTVRR